MWTYCNNLPDPQVRCAVACPALVQENWPFTFDVEEPQRLRSNGRATSPAPQELGGIELDDKDWTPERQHAADMARTAAAQRQAAAAAAAAAAEAEVEQAGGGSPSLGSGGSGAAAAAAGRSPSLAKPVSRSAAAAAAQEEEEQETEVRGREGVLTRGLCRTATYP